MSVQIHTTKLITVIWVLLALLSSAAQPSNSLAQDAILPHGDPRLQSTEEERARQDDIRDSRLTQQGQGLNYRVEGQPRPFPMPETNPGDGPGQTKQDTGLEDPTVNPGQASVMRAVQGRIIQSESGTHVVRQLSGSDISVTIDDQTAGDKDVQPGDVITGFVTPEGRAVAIHKAQKEE